MRLYRTVHDERNRGLILKLEKAPFQHVLRVDFLNTEQIQHHVVGEMEGRVDGIRLALNDLFSSSRADLLIHHQNNKTLLIKTSTSSTSRHLDVFSRCDEPAKKVKHSLSSPNF
jgi:hypothetical protein